MCENEGLCHEFPGSYDHGTCVNEPSGEPPFYTCNCDEGTGWHNLGDRLCVSKFLDQKPKLAPSMHCSNKVSQVRQSCKSGKSKQATRAIKKACGAKRQHERGEEECAYSARSGY